MAKFTTAIVGVIVLCAGFTSGQLDLEEGDSCTETVSGSPGVCVRFVNCPTAINNWKLHDQRPTVCSYTGDMAVVCCKRSVPGTTPLPVLQPAPLPVLQPAPPRVKPTNTTKRISELKCEEYSKPVMKTVTFVPLTPGPDPKGFYIKNCTYGKVEPYVRKDGELRRWKGPEAPTWLAFCPGGYEFKCGGSLVSERYVLTAGHCTATSSLDMKVTSVKPTMIRLGDDDLRPDVDDGSRPVDVRIERIIKHPNYKPPVTYNDIALLEMAQSVEFNSFVRPACLWQSDDFGGLDSAVITGWGTTTNRGTLSDRLLRTTLKLFSNDFCQPLLSHLRNRKWKEGFRREQMCAGDLEGKRDSCQGDSGGPLHVSLGNNSCIFHVMGITSFGYECGVVNGPGIYTRVSSYVPWIESVVWPNSA